MASVSRQLNIDYSVLGRCWSEHDMDPVRNLQRRVIRAKKRLARAEAHHKRVKAPTAQSRGEMDAALKSLLDLEKLLGQATKEAREIPLEGGPLTSEEAAKFQDYMDAIIEEGSRRHYACNEVKIMGLGIQMSNNPELLPIFRRIADDPTLLGAVHNLIRGFA
jgi:hypothetical protein